MRKVDRVVIECQWCGSSIKVRPLEVDTRKYCNNSCKHNKFREDPYHHTIEAKSRIGKASKSRKRRSGGVAPNKGKRPSPETIRKISVSLKRSKAGKHSWNWKGASSENRLERYRFSIEMRSEILKRDNFKCTSCGSGDDFTG